MPFKKCARRTQEVEKSREPQIKALIFHFISPFFQRQFSQYVYNNTTYLYLERWKRDKSGNDQPKTAKQSIPQNLVHN